MKTKLLADPVHVQRRGVEMAGESDNVVPFWALSSAESELPVPVASGMTPEKLRELRTVLAALADEPVVTLEAHPLPDTFDRKSGMVLSAGSPIAKYLAQLASTASKPQANAAGEVLYRMVVPGKVAAQFGQKLVQPMSANGGGVYSALVGSSGIAAQARFVPVAATKGAGAAGAGAAITAAGPLILMGAATALSAYADYQRDQAIARIEDLLTKLDSKSIDDERKSLAACKKSINKATALLMDQGEIGFTLGVDSAVHAVDMAVAEAERRLAGWTKALDSLHPKTIASTMASNLAKLGGPKMGASPVPSTVQGPVELAELRKALAGVDKKDGDFAAHLELARLAIALKRRIILLQAVEHGQKDSGNQLRSFIKSLQADRESLDDLETGIDRFLTRLSGLELKRSSGFASFNSSIDELLAAVYRLRELGAQVQPSHSAADVAIDIWRRADGSVKVLPARAELSVAG